MNNVKISIIGLGYVGLPLAIEFGKFFPTVGFDTDIERIQDLKLAIDKNQQLNSDEIRAAKSMIFSCEDHDISQSNVYVITVPTPVDEFNQPDLRPLQEATKLVARFLKSGDVVIFESTVYPGCTEEICVPILESENKSGLIYNKSFFCGYSPERINPGDKVHTLTAIKKITSGSNIDTAAFVDRLYSKIINAGTYKASSIKVAEAAKVIENSQRDINIAFMNELSIIFNLLNIDTSEVLKAASTKWNFLAFKPGLVGGHCIGVDPYYLTHKAQQMGYKPEVILSGRKINDNMPAYIASKLVKLLINNGHDLTQATIGVLGVTFKEDCPDIRNSKTIELIRELKGWGLKVLASDPLVDPSTLSDLNGIELSNHLLWTNLDAVVIAVPHESFCNLRDSFFESVCTKKLRPVIADLKSIINNPKLSDQKFDVFCL